MHCYLVITPPSQARVLKQIAARMQAEELRTRLRADVRLVRVRVSPDPNPHPIPKGRLYYYRWAQQALLHMVAGAQALLHMVAGAQPLLHMVAGAPQAQGGGDQEGGGSQEEDARGRRRLGGLLY